MTPRKKLPAPSHKAPATTPEPSEKPKITTKLGKPQTGRVSKKSTKKGKMVFDPSGPICSLNLSFAIDKEANALVPVVHKPDGTVARIDPDWIPTEADLHTISKGKPKDQTTTSATKKAEL